MPTLKYTVEQYCPLIYKHTPVDERVEDITGWVAIFATNDKELAHKRYARPHMDNKKRNTRLVTVIG